MYAISDHDAVDLWAIGGSYHPLDRRLLILAAAGYDDTETPLASVDVQARDQALLEIRVSTFGDLLELCADCPECGTAVEFEVPAGELLIAPHQSRQVEIGGWQVDFRVPTSLDLAAAINDGVDVLTSCIVSVACPEDLDDNDLPAPIRAAVEAAMASCAPASDIEFVTSCPDCAVDSQVAFDIGDVLWAELASHARGLLRDVVVLARAFGWSEQAILELDPVRRRTYVEAVS